MEHDECVPDEDGHPELRDAGDTKTFEGFDPDGEMPPMAAEDADIDVEIDGTPWVEQKLAAMKAHATQITSDGFFFASEPVLGDQVVVARVLPARGRRSPSRTTATAGPTTSSPA